MDGASPIAPIPPHVQLLHAAYGVEAVRLCFSSTSQDPAEPRDNIVPLTNYPGLAPGGMADITGVHALADPFLVDAWKMALVEQLPKMPALVPCQNASMLGSAVGKTVVPPAVLPTGPSLLSLVGCPANAPDATLAICGADPMTSSLALSPIALTPNLTSPTMADVVMLSRTIGGATIGFGKLGTCPALVAVPGFGQRIPFGAFTTPTADFDTTGLIVCDAKARVVREWSWTTMQLASAPSMTPGDFYGRRGLYAFVIAGEEGVKDQRFAPHALALLYEVSK
jgi:hypothetical protein